VKGNRGETHIRIAKHRNGTLETIKLRAMLHIQKFVDDDGSDSLGPGLPGSWKPVSDDSGSAGGSRLFIQTGSRMNNVSDDEDDPF
jgi:replicative DNA helicase